LEKRFCLQLLHFSPCSLRKKVFECDFENPTEFTLYELCLVKLGTFSKDLKATVEEAKAHVMSCKVLTFLGTSGFSYTFSEFYCLTFFIFQHCHMHGHICEGCRSDDILFPFQTSLVCQCRDCNACYHQPCYENLAKTKRECSKCHRVRERKLRKEETAA
jgi:hypothetical protein